MLRKLLSMLCFVAFFAQIAFAQAGSIIGQVTDSNNESIPGANVLLVETGQGAATNAEGNYNISNVEAGTYTLRVSFVGFETNEQEVTVEAGETLEQNIVLQSGSLGLDEVVVTGYGEFSRRNFTGSVSQVSSDDFENSPVTSIEQSLEGNVAGANISAATGTPGAEQQIRIRGLSSINAGVDPLYVIDGVPVVGGTNTESEATSSLGVLSNISASDIESVTILKDASSTAPYGARGSNGVVVIETKEGRSGDVTYSVNIQRGYNNRAVDGPGTINAQEWTDLYYESLGNLAGTDDRAQLDQIAAANNFPNYAASWDGETNTDWGDIVTNDNAVQQEYNLSAQGGNEQTNFYAAAGFYEQQGQSIGSGLERYSGKLNISHKLDDRITLDNSFTGSFVEQDGILEGSGYFGSPVLAEYFQVPVDPAYNEDGSPNTNLSPTVFNPIYIQNNDIDRKRNSRVLNNTTLDFNIQENFSFTTNFSVDYILTEEKYYNNPFYGDGEDTGGEVNDIYNRNFNYVWRNNLNYIYEVNQDNVFDIRLISESQKNNASFVDAWGEGIAAAELFNLSTVATPQGVLGESTDWAVQSFTGLVNYNYNDKILTDLSLRYEGNSRFSDDKRWGTFWSVGVGYILSEEEFLQNTEWLNFLKVRASYGLTGNASIDLNSFQTLVSFGGYNDQPNIQPDQLGNPNLTWEKANSLDLALEFETFDRIDGSFTFFYKESRDLLFDVPLSYTTGHDSQIQNSGDLYNQGVEIELNANVVNTRDFSWDVGGNFTVVNNEITDLPVDVNGDPVEITSSTRYTAVEGYEVNAWYMKEWAGVDPENGDPLWYIDDEDGGRTTTNDYNAADSYYQGGNAQPTEYGGINTRVDLFGFYVDANMSFAFGHKIFDNWAYYMQSDGGFSYSYGQYANQADYWQESGDEASNPRPVFGGNNFSNETSSRFLYDGDYVRLKSLNIGYTIPVQYVKNLGLKSATVYFNSRNLWTYMFDEDLKYDPEQKADGFTDLNAQPLKSLTFGIKANF